MLSKITGVTLVFVAAACLSVVWFTTSAQAQNPVYKTGLPSAQGGLSAANARALTLGVVYDQPPSLSGGLYPSSRNPAGTDYDQYVWDDFTLQASPGITITEVRWRGGYQSGSGTVLTFTVAIYASTAGAHSRM